MRAAECGSFGGKLLTVHSSTYFIRDVCEGVCGCEIAISFNISFIALRLRSREIAFGTGNLAQIMLGKRIVARVGYRMMSGRPYALMVKVKVKPERRDEFLAVMAADAVGTRAEPENLRFDLFQDDEDAHTYHLYSVYKSPKGLDAH